jgi:hypothetical protein
MSQLNPFLEGWGKLPDEVQLEVLRHALPTNVAFRAVDFDHPSTTIHRPKNRDMYMTQVLPLLSCPPIRHLAVEAFYTQNIMENRTAPDPTRFPPRHCRSYIRILVAHVIPGVVHLRVIHWTFNKSRGLSNLQTLDLTLLASYNQLEKG